MATFISNSRTETIAFARDWLVCSSLTTLLRSSAISAGRCTSSKAWFRAWRAPTKVTSPTFTLLHEYRKGRLPVFHFDFFRLKQQSEIDEIGFYEYLDEGGVLVIEWADRFPQALPAGTRWLRIEAVSEEYAS